MSLNHDPRWRRFQDGNRACPCCGRTFGGVFDIGYDHPDAWPHGHRGASGRQVLAVGQDRLSSDLCRFGARHFLRALLALPIEGSKTSFAFGPWAEVTEADFYRYAQAWQAEDYTGLEDLTGALANTLPGFSLSLGQPVKIDLGDGTVRPHLLLSGLSPLAFAQQDGVTFDRLLDVYAAAGHDVRPHLLAG